MGDREGYQGYQGHGGARETRWPHEGGLHAVLAICEVLQQESAERAAEGASVQCVSGQAVLQVVEKAWCGKSNLLLP